MSPLNPDQPRAPRLNVQNIQAAEPVVDEPLTSPPPPLTHEQAAETYHWWAARAAGDYNGDRTRGLLAANLAQAWASYAQYALFAQPQVELVSQEHGSDEIVAAPGLLFNGRAHSAVLRDGQLVALRFPTAKGEVELPSTLTSEEVDLILASVETVLTR